MGVEASRAALAHLPGGSGAEQVFFSTTRPPYLDKTNAGVLHAALGLDQDAFAVDMVGSVRSGVGALKSALASSEASLAVSADIRTGLPGGVDERDGGDGAAALLCAAAGEFIADYLGGDSASAEFLDRWRVPGEIASKVWEERFGESAYVPLAAAAVSRAFEQVGITATDIDHLIVTGLQARAVRSVAKAVGVRPEALVDDLTGVVGNTGTAHPALLLASVLDVAAPAETIAVVVLADGVDVMIFRTTELLPSRRQPLGVRAQIEASRDDLSYAKYLTWRGILRTEPPRRPDPVPPAAPPSYRSERWKYAFVGSRCSCGTVHLPPARVCMRCHAVDQVSPESMREVKATIATYTIDHLTYSESPPAVVGVLDFDGGGRFQCQLTDVDPDSLSIGDRVEMTFRNVYTANGIHNYFWKARPVRGQD